MFKKELPVFIFNGFLDSGKTKLMKEILESDDYYHDGKTLVIQTEEGTISLESSWCQEYHINVELCLEDEMFNKEYIANLVKKYQPNQIFLELNAFFDIQNLVFPKQCKIYQWVTTIDTTKFEIFYNNMKQIFNNMVSNATIIIFNRSDDIEGLGNYRRMIRAFNQQAQIGFEDKNGNVKTTLDEDLPYNINDDFIELKDEDYPVWYLDIFDNYDKYKGKTIKYRAYVRDVTKETIIVGRRIMTCCEADIQFCGYECLTDQFVQNNSFVMVTGKVVKHFSEIANEEVMMLELTDIEKLPYVEEKYLTF